MGFSLLPKEYKFFDLFNKQAAFAIEASLLFKELIIKGNFDDKAVSKMRKIEHSGDEVTHDIINNLNKTFITPFDREDIHALAHELDGVIDLINTITNRMRLYNLTTVNENMNKFADLIVKSVEALSKAVSNLRDLKKPKTILEHCIEINRLEDEGDELRDLVMGKLFDDNHPPIYVIKWKDIYQDAETVLDLCEDVANIVESILVKQA